jgi:hypothetical protein
MSPVVLSTDSGDERESPADPASAIDTPIESKPMIACSLPLSTRTMVHHDHGGMNRMDTLLETQPFQRPASTASVMLRSIPIRWLHDRGIVAERAGRAGDFESIAGSLFRNHQPILARLNRALSTLELVVNSGRSSGRPRATN